jgi:hypothetical protein
MVMTYIIDEKVAYKHDMTKSSIDLVITSIAEHISKLDASQQGSTGVLVHILILCIISKVNNFVFGEDQGARRRKPIFTGRHNRRLFRSTHLVTVRTIVT